MEASPVVLSFVAMALLGACREADAKEEGPQDLEAWLAGLPAELRARRKEIPDPKNAYPLWAELDAEALDPDSEKVKNLELKEYLTEELWWEEDTGFPGGELGRRLRGWIDAKLPHLEKLDQGIARGACQFPGTEFDPGSVVVKLNRAASLKLLQAKRLAADGRFQASRDELRCLLRMSQVLGKPVGGITQYNAAGGYEAMALRGIRWLAGVKKVPQVILESLDLPEDENDGFRGAWASELCQGIIPQIIALPDSGEPDEIARALLPEIRT